MPVNKNLCVARSNVQYARDVWVFLVALLALFSSYCYSDSPDTKPALFGDAGAELIESFVIPEGASFQKITVRCGGSLGSSGRFRVLLCATTSLEDSLARELSENVADAAKKLKLQPAIVKGARKRVWFVFTMVIERLKHGDAVRIYHNDLASEDSLGPGYIAPQRHRFPRWGRRLSCSSPTGLGRGVIAIANVRVTERGKANSVSLDYHPDDIKCAAAIENALMDSDYIPANVDGVPVAAAYNEIFGR